MFRCKKDEKGYWHHDELYTVGRPEEDLLLELNLMDLFPGLLKDVMVVREDEEVGRRR